MGPRLAVQAVRAMPGAWLRLLQGLGFRVLGLGLRADWGAGFRVLVFGFRVPMSPKAHRRREHHWHPGTRTALLQEKSHRFRV